MCALPSPGLGLSPVSGKEFLNEMILYQLPKEDPSPCIVVCLVDEGKWSSETTRPMFAHPETSRTALLCALHETR
jgi:hypothetical protein